MIAFVLLFADVSYGQYVSPAVDFFMHGRTHETLLRDYYRFEEPKPLRIEYSNVNWLDSGPGADEYKDFLHLETALSLYKGQKLSVSAPIRYSYMPIWSETQNLSFGDYLNVIQPHIIFRWKMTDRFKSTAGFEYNLKGDGKYFGKPSGRMVCLFKGSVSCDLNAQLSFVTGARFDRYYYDYDNEGKIGVLKLADRMYFGPMVALNWHPNDNFLLLLGMPDSGIHVAFGDFVKAEIRASANEGFEIAIRARPLSKLNIALRHINTTYADIPIKSIAFGEGGPSANRLSYVDSQTCIEIGRLLNPAAIAGIEFRYGHDNNLKFKNETNSKIATLNNKPRFAIGIVFTVDFEALFQVR